MTLAVVALAGALAADSVLVRWTAGPVLLAAGAAGTFDEVAVKDPSLVHHGGLWHLFYTARSRTGYSLGYVSSVTLDTLSQRRRHALVQLRSQGDAYAAAPQVFYFRPQKRWYMIFQTQDSNYQPVYSTTVTLSDPRSWTPPRPLVAKRERAKWIDFWVICDDRRAYLFYTRDHREVIVRSTLIEQFPEGFGEGRAVFTPVHESVHVYRGAGRQPRYLMFFERQENDLRSFGLAVAPTLDGPWSEANPRLASGGQIDYPQGLAPWTTEVSHGELVREGVDERLELPGGLWEFLMQGLPAGAHTGGYPMLPWRLGMIRTTPRIDP